MLEFLLAVGTLLAGAGLYMWLPDGHKRWGIALTAVGALILVYAALLALRPESVPVTIASRLHIAYSSRQVLQAPNGHAQYNTALHLDDVATLWLSEPSNDGMATLLWPTLPAVNIAHPRAGGSYNIPGEGTLHVGQLPIQGLSLLGNAQRITFDSAHRVQYFLADKRLFRVSLEAIRDESGSKTKVPLIEYEFAISEEEPSAINRGITVIRQPSQPTPPQTRATGAFPAPPDEIQTILTDMRDRAVATMILILPTTTFDGRPNVVLLSAGTKLFLFDPTAQEVIFHMKTNAGKSIDLHLPLGTPIERGPLKGQYAIAIVWDNSKGGRLHVNKEVSADGI
jgi:hypothetical protein